MQVLLIGWLVVTTLLLQEGVAGLLVWRQDEDEE